MKYQITNGDISRYEEHLMQEEKAPATIEEYIAAQPDMNLVQLVSFGCGVDAITTDEVREILEEEHKIYTQIKIDEITNLGAVKIRLRSLFAAIRQQRGEQTREEGENG